MAPYYPPIEEKNFLLIKRLQADNEGYFEDPSCPYSKDFVKIFTVGNGNGNNGTGGGEGEAPPVIDAETIENMTNEDVMLAEVIQLYQHLKLFGESMRESDSAAEKNTYFKLSYGLLGKLLDMKERIVNIKNMNAFIAEVINIMEESLDVDQRAEITKRLKSVLDTE